MHEEMGNTIFKSKNLKESGYLGELDVDRIILK
jgi:hypothetical protein